MINTTHLLWSVYMLVVHAIKSQGLCYHSHQYTLPLQATNTATKFAWTKETNTKVHAHLNMYMYTQHVHVSIQVHHCIQKMVWEVSNQQLSFKEKLAQEWLTIAYIQWVHYMYRMHTQHVHMVGNLEVYELLRCKWFYTEEKLLSTERTVGGK